MSSMARHTIIEMSPRTMLLVSRSRIDRMLTTIPTNARTITTTDAWTAALVAGQPLEKSDLATSGAAGAEAAVR